MSSQALKKKKKHYSFPGTNIHSWTSTTFKHLTGLKLGGSPIPLKT